MEKNMLLIITILAIGLVVVSLVMAYSMTQKQSITVTQPGGESDINTISVSGQGMLTVSPDKAEVFLNIETEGKTAEEAQAENRRIESSVLDALKKAGVAKEDIETSSYYLTPRYRWDGRVNQIIGYTQYHTMKVTTLKIDDVGDIIDTAVEAGANGVQNVNFDLSNEKREDVNQELLGKASGNAREKAQAIADGLGVKLGKIARITESNYYYTPYRYADFAMAKGMEEAAPAPATEILPQDLEMQATISVSYFIE